MKPTPHGPRVLGVIDLVLFYVITGFAVQWIAAAAAAGPKALFVWPLSFLLFYVPLALSVMELSSRYPEDGGLYIWSREAFGEFAGFTVGWSYWFSNLPYFANVLYFAASNTLYLGDDHGTHFGNSATFFVTFSLVALTLITLANLVGLNIGKWITNIGALSMWLASVILIVVGAVALHRFGSATPINRATVVPRFQLSDLLFWSSMTYAFAGTEAASFMAGEIKSPRRSIPLAIVFSGTIIVSFYFLGTLATLWSLPAGRVTNLVGPIAAIAEAARRLDAPWITPLVALLVALGNVGAAGSYLGACARIPFAVGVDKRLPKAFARLHPKWGTPHVALLSQAVLAAVVIVVSQAGDTVKSAYYVLISMTIVANFVPYIVMFAALIKLQSVPTGTTVVRIPGGKPVAIALALIGLSSSLLAVVFACLPSPEEQDKVLASIKILGASGLMFSVGWLIYWAPWRRRARSNAIAMAVQHPVRRNLDPEVSDRK